MIHRFFLVYVLAVSSTSFGADPFTIMQGRDALALSSRRPVSHPTVPFTLHLVWAIKSTTAVSEMRETPIPSSIQDPKYVTRNA